MKLPADKLIQFVRQSDLLGGPGHEACNHYWAGLSYEPSYKVNELLDPFSEAYVAEQIAVYEELSGRRYNVREDEATTFDVDRHIGARNPYDHPEPSELALHLQRLSRALRFAKVKRGEVLLDMGCGWGLSSELAEYLGLTVIAVDVNPNFVRLVNERARLGGRQIQAIEGTFEEFAPSKPADLALFYECFHHAVRPWIVVDRLASFLKPGGRLVLAGEPINSHWWKSWGMRLDPMSIYCIRKFGWFESGWSLPFLTQVLHRAGLVPATFVDPDPEIGISIIAEKALPHRVPGDLAAQLFSGKGCIEDAGASIFSGAGGLKISMPEGALKATLNFVNHRGRGLDVRLSINGVKMFDGSMASGRHAISVPHTGLPVELIFQIERWVPDEELHNGDQRVIGLHLESVTFDS